MVNSPEFKCWLARTVVVATKRRTRPRFLRRNDSHFLPFVSRGRFPGSNATNRYEMCALLRAVLSFVIARDFENRIWAIFSSAKLEL